MKSNCKRYFFTVISACVFVAIITTDLYDNSIESRACKTISGFAGTINGNPTYTYKWNYKCGKQKKKNPKKLSEKAINIVKKYEGFFPNRYRGLDNYNYTIGYGHVIQPWDDIQEPISEQEATSLLKTDLESNRKPTRIFLNTVAEIHVKKNQMDALVSLRFNVGPKALSSLYSPKLTDLLRSGNWTKDMIVEEFGSYCLYHDADGNAYHSKGLWRRHVNEALLFLTGKYKNYSIKKLEKKGYHYPYDD